MSFDYDRIAHKNSEHSSWWTSYADLFMMLSIVFLLMYVASSLRSGSAGFQQQQEYKKLAEHAQDLEEQIKVYSTLKEDALKKQSSAAEQQVYDKLMSHLNLLQDEARDEKNELEKKAKEHEDKVFALNQYQQLVRNMVNASVLAKTQIAHRDDLLVARDATIEEKKAKINELEQATARNEAQIAQINQALAQKVSALQSAQKATRTSRKAMEAKIAALRAESEARVQALDAKNREINNALGQAKGTLAETEKKLGDAEGTIATQQKQVGALSGKLAGAEAEKGKAMAQVAGLKGDLARVQEIANAKQKLAGQIGQQFAKSGIKAAVDGKSGEVTLDFGGEYFDTGSSQLKPGMRAVLDKVMPMYARSLFTDPKIADKIANVEIVGYASSTFRGKYVNPSSTNAADKEAIQYNLNLSFGRANSIFQHVLNQSGLSPADQKRLLPLLKVVGRGYLPEGRSPASLPSEMPEGEFCKKFDCKKAQKVVIKFNMKD